MRERRISNVMRSRSMIGILPDRQDCLGWTESAVSDDEADEIEEHLRGLG